MAEDSLPVDDESRHGDSLDDEVDFPAPDEILARQRARYAQRFARAADAPPVQRRKRGEPFVPSVEWVRAFRTQCTREAREAVKRYAYTQSAWLEGAGLAAGDHWVQEQVQRAIADTLDGRIRWRLERISLVYHLRDTIRARAWKLMERSKRVREVSLEEGQVDEHVEEAEVDERPTELEASLEARRGRRERDELATADLIAKVLAGSRAAAEQDGDDQARRIHDAFDQGLTEKAEVCAFTGLSEDDYHNARRRIVRRAKRLRDDLQQVAMEALSREPE